MPGLDALKHRFGVFSARPCARKEACILKSGRRCFSVAEAGHVFGIITLQDVTRVAQTEWERVQVGEAMTPLPALKHVSPGADLYTAMEVMAREDLNQLPVMEGHHFLGMISRDAILAYLTARGELGLLPTQGRETPAARQTVNRGAAAL